MICTFHLSNKERMIIHPWLSWSYRNYFELLCKEASKGGSGMCVLLTIIRSLSCTLYGNYPVIDLYSLRITYFSLEPVIHFIANIGCIFTQKNIISCRPTGDVLFWCSVFVAYNVGFIHLVILRRSGRGNSSFTLMNDWLATGAGGVFFGTYTR